MKRMTFAGILLGSLMLQAAVDWPADFEANLAAHLAEITPSGSAVGTLARTDQDLAGCSVAAKEAGTALAPIDFMSVSWYWSNCIDMKSTPPTGLMLFFR